MSFKNVCSEIAENVKEKWSYDNTCPATTSRGLSPSSGDHDDSETYSFCSGKCSCCSDYRDISECCEKPFTIIDSTTNLNKSKWNAFKSYLKRHIKLKRNNAKRKTIANRLDHVYDNNSKPHCSTKP